MTSRTRFHLIAVAVLVATAAVPASAEIVFLSAGRTLSVKSHRIEGESIVLTLRSGGEVMFDRALVDRIEPDEVPYVDPGAPAEPVVAQAPVQDLSVLESTPYGQIIASMSEVHGVNPLLVRALIQVESGYKPKAKSPRGAAWWSAPHRWKTKTAGR